MLPSTLGPVTGTFRRASERKRDREGGRGVVRGGEGEREREREREREKGKKRDKKKKRKKNE